MSAFIILPSWDIGYLSCISFKSSVLVEVYGKTYVTIKFLLPVLKPYFSYKCGKLDIFPWTQGTMGNALWMLLEGLCREWDEERKRRLMPKIYSRMPKTCPILPKMHFKMPKTKFLALSEYPLKCPFYRPFSYSYKCNLPKTYSFLPN